MITLMKTDDYDDSDYVYVDNDLDHNYDIVVHYYSDNADDDSAGNLYSNDGDYEDSDDDDNGNDVIVPVAGDSDIVSHFIFRMVF